MLGLIIGVYRFSAARRYKRGTSLTPYTGWMQWHHYAGLLFGVVTLTWVFSRLLTMTPWNLFAQRGPTAAQMRAIGGDGVALDRFTSAPGEAIAVFQKQFQPKEIVLLQFMEKPFYAAYQLGDGGSSRVLVAAIVGDRLEVVARQSRSQPIGVTVTRSA